MRIGPPDTISEAHIFRMYLLIMKKKLFFNVNLFVFGVNANAYTVLIFFRLTVVQILMAARSVHRKKKLNHFLTLSFVPIE